ncbi:uncharacterized protein LOC123008232 isoform X1 [Tribolium madens]|uniref:uncharacterized protein LOC123008232 isoform X1 n=1 Tax=Tribolium madens TaxID=41895 RepID=UPI001CF75744|nr:uncharacterized protein LOC123008232 isoform X1 [Tribolium madens]XP_044259871.1 uncharacterized protein LOC123008232 isoform X1 [Tribolium madens]
MEKTGGKFVLEWETHSKQVSRGLCMLMERQCLVDIAVCCGSNTLHAHKCVLAASSSYFKEHLENKAIEQVVINGLDFAVMKSLIEFMYSGECAFAEDHLKYFIAAVKFFKITALENIFAENEYQNTSADEVCIPPPQFICKPPKYPTVYKPFSNASLSPKINYALSNVYGQHKFKRKCLGSEAEKACAKEAQASRIALANLRKVMASTPQVHSFIVEESFNETTVENFIPNVEENYVENIHDVQFVNGNPPQVTTNGKPLVSNTQSLTADKIKHILGNDEVEIMFQTSDGNFVNVSDEVLLNLSKGGLQYQVVDENGHIGEIQELKTLEPDSGPKDDQKLKREQGFDLKIIKNPDEIDKIAKAMPEEYIDPNFSSAACNKTNMESLQLHTSFNEDLYENSFHMQSAEMFEPENLSMHSDLMADNPMEFESDLKYKYLSSKMSTLNNTHDTINFDEHIITKIDSVGEDPLRDTNEMLVTETDTTKSSENKSSLKFTPDMFFTTLPANSCTEDKSKIPAENGVAK